MAAITDDQIKEAFSLFDVTESGVLGADDLALSLKALGFGDVTAEEAGNYIAEANAEEGAAAEEGEEAVAAPVANTITFEKFSELVKSKMAAADSDEEIQRAFDLFLKTVGGDKQSIDLETMLAVAKRLGQKDDEQLLLEMIAEASSDKQSTSISREDFTSVMLTMKGK